MKKCFLLFAILIISARISSQTITATTWYVIPPTSGCNGIWAIDASAWPCFTSGCSYAAASPWGCLTTTFPVCDSIVADTLYLPLCSLPCNIAASCSPGPMVICGTPPPVTTGVNQPFLEKIKASLTDGILNIENLNPNEIIEVYDVSGRQIIAKKNSGTKEEIDFTSLSRQVYILLVKNKTNETIYRKKIAW